MSLKELENDIKENNLHGIYFFYGEESYDIERYIEKMKKCFKTLVLGVNFFEIDKTNIPELESVCEGMSFFGDEKFVIIKDTGLKFNMQILQNISNDKLVIVVTEKTVDKRTTDFKTLSKLSNNIEFAKQTEKDAVFFVVRTLNAYNIKIKDEVAMYMVAVCTENKQILINEFRKIVAYIAPGEELTKDIIDRIATKTIDAKIFDITELLIKNQKEKALKLFDDLISMKTYPGIIESLLFKHIKNIYEIKLMLEDDYYKNKDIAKELGIHPFVYSKLRPLVSKYTVNELEYIINEFEEYDVKSKIGKIDSIIGLKKILMFM